MRAWLRAKGWATLVIVLAFGISLIDVILPLHRDPTHLEAALLRSIYLVVGLWGAYILGRQSAREAARDLMQPHARSAFRRLLSLYGSLGRVAQNIQDFRQASIPAETGYQLLQAVVKEQLATAGDAMEDWRDIVPEEVALVEARLRVEAPTLRDDDNE